jgi:Methyltransferase domain
MLDMVDRFLPSPPGITLVEPFPVILRKLLRPDDYARVTLIEDRVQHVPLERFKALGPGDLLFIDSSHVLKCGSDVQFLLFEVLPVLAVGVVVHFHDVFESFEYPREWLMEVVLERRLRAARLSVVLRGLGDFPVWQLRRQQFP